MNRVCAVVPVYNHPEKVETIVQQLVELSLPVLLVDDGSSKDCNHALRNIAQRYRSVTLLTRMRNGGKGAAVKSGLRRAYRVGYSHAVQIDAGGQYDLTALRRLLEVGEQYPDTVISGRTLTGNMPIWQRIRRKLTHVMIWINTLSLAIKDATCGFRLYPVVPIMNILERSHMGRRMEFDPEILVRLHWRGVLTQYVPVDVSYSKEGISPPHPWRDNLLMLWMHVRLFFGMLKRFPVILWRRRRMRKAAKMSALTGN